MKKNMLRFNREIKLDNNKTTLRPDLTFGDRQNIIVDPSSAETKVTSDLAFAGRLNREVREPTNDRGFTVKINDNNYTYVTIDETKQKCSR